MEPIERELLKIRGKIVELYRMDDNTYKAFATEYLDDDEIVGVGESDDRESAIKLALQDLYIELKNTR
ncbi:hypothetical protein [Caldifermentibacillus hisashii]|jgi:hypothetical protein|uniref:hypothetical protein n=1 Tax=Caldifermentibacillus hisashii TaxID=996558 RepID=UPI0030E92483